MGGARISIFVADQLTYYARNCYSTFLALIEPSWSDKFSPMTNCLFFMACPHFFLTFFLGKRTKSHITMALQGNIPNCCVSPLFFHFYHAAFFAKEMKNKNEKRNIAFKLSFLFSKFRRVLRLDSSGKLYVLTLV